MDSFFISTPIYYVNARPHLGHAYTTILADSVNRMHKLLGQETFFLTGTDEHGDKIVQAAQAQGQTPQQYVDGISQLFADLWPQLGIENNFFVRTTFKEHRSCVQRFLQQVYEQGDIYFGEYGGYYCFGCERFYTEKELQDGLCPDHLKKPEFIQEKNYFFRMSKYQDWLRQHIENHPDFIQPKQYRNEVLALLKEPLDDLCISRPKTRLTWGIELPFDRNFVTYVWFDALINYISSLGWPDGELYKKFWPNAYHVVAKDILKPHAIFWPTMLRAAGLPVYKGLRVHGYWKVDETKMSKSLGNVVEPLSLRKKYGLAGFRYFLLREMHFGQDGNFSEANLVKRFNSDLANDLGNLFNRSLAMSRKYFAGVVPEASDLSSSDQALIDLGKAAIAGYVQLFQDCQTAQALEKLWEFVRGINKYIDEQAPWALNKAQEIERLGTVLAVVLSALHKVSIALWPVMPEASKKMSAQLGLDVDLSSCNLLAEVREWTFLAPGTSLAKASNLFPRQEILPSPDMESREDQERELGSAKGGAAKEGLIDFELFKKVDLRVGQIKEAEKVKGADRLLQLKVDLGEQELRQIIAGVAEAYQPNELLGREVIVVANLKPRKLRGLISQGMILAAHGENGLQLLGPWGEVDPGSRVS